MKSSTRRCLMSEFPEWMEQDLGLTSLSPEEGRAIHTMLRGGTESTLKESEIKTLIEHAILLGLIILTVVVFAYARGC